MPMAFHREDVSLFPSLLSPSHNGRIGAQLYTPRLPYHLRSIRGNPGTRPPRIVLPLPLHVPDPCHIQPGSGIRLCLKDISDGAVPSIQAQSNLHSHSPCFLLKVCQTRITFPVAADSSTILWSLQTHAASSIVDSGLSPFLIHFSTNQSISRSNIS